MAPLEARDVVIAERIESWQEPPSVRRRDESGWLG
jgi:hypothetical protein